MLTKEEQKEATKLAVANVEKDGITPRKDADLKQLKRLHELLGKQDEKPAKPIKQPRKNHKLTRVAQELKEAGAEYLGCENVNRGSDEKPRLVLREYFYRKNPEGRQEAVMVQKDRAIVIGRTIAENALERIA